MRQLIQIELKKYKNYRTFWVIVGLYFISLAVTTMSGMEFLKWIKRMFTNFGGDLNITRIPLYHFPDIWQNLFWVSGLFKFVLGIWVIIAITNEYQYRTIRQNIIDGMSRWDFVYSKILSNLILSFLSVALVSLVILVTGFIYTPTIVFSEVLDGADFIVGYFLEIFFYLSFALMIGLLVKRSGLSIVLLILSPMIELIVRVNVDNYSEAIIPFFPLEAGSNVVPLPFPRYLFQEIQDELSAKSALICTAWIIIFNWISYLKIQKTDL